MGVHTLRSPSNDVTVAEPTMGDVMVGNAAGVWQALPLDDPTAFPFLAFLRQRIEELESRVEALEGS